MHFEFSVWLYTVTLCTGASVILLFVSVLCLFCNVSFGHSKCLGPQKVSPAQLLAKRVSLPPRHPSSGPYICQKLPLQSLNCVGGNE